MWRTISSGVDDGVDIAQLEQNLTDLGFGTDVMVDEEFDKPHPAAIKAWQDGRRLKKTGVVNPGDVVDRAGPVRVAEHEAERRRPSVAGGPQRDRDSRSSSSTSRSTRSVAVARRRGEDRAPRRHAVDGTVASVGARPR